MKHFNEQVHVIDVNQTFNVRAAPALGEDGGSPGSGECLSGKLAGCAWTSAGTVQSVAGYDATDSTGGDSWAGSTNAEGPATSIAEARGTVCVRSETMGCLAGSVAEEGRDGSAEVAETGLPDSAG